MKNTLLNSNAIRFLSSDRNDRSYFMRQMFHIRVLGISIGNDDISDLDTLSTVTVRSLKEFL